MWRRLSGAALLLLILGWFAPLAAGGVSTITIGTAGKQGVYYPAGGAICRLINRGTPEHGLRCNAEATEGSVFNLEALREGDFSFVIAQSDWVYHAYHGSRDFADKGPDKELRSIFSLHTEVFTVLARADSGIHSLRDLRHKRVGLPDEGSGMRATAEEFLKAQGWGNDTFSRSIDFDPDNQAEALCANKVDAILFVTGHPNGGTTRATHSCDTKLIAVEGPEIDALLKKNPYYLRVTLPGGMYPGMPAPLSTFGVKAALVASAGMDDGTVYQLVKAVMENFDTFKSLHPLFSSLDKKSMATRHMTAPLHPAALRYYRETGLID